MSKRDVRALASRLADANLTWDYRIVRFPIGGKHQTLLEVKEVYFDGDRPVAFANAAVAGDNLEELAEDLRQHLSATTKPIIDARDIRP